MYRIGVDLGGTNIAVGLVNEEFEIVKKVSAPTGADRSADAIAADIAKLCLKVCEEVGVSMSEVLCVGIATPGIANVETGNVEYSCNLPFRKFPLAESVGKALNFDNVKIANDANAAALGEAVAGAAKGTKNSMMITLGTGVGGGAVINGKLFEGNCSAGTEFGHSVIVANGEQCTCGRKGCLEAYTPT